MTPDDKRKSARIPVQLTVRFRKENNDYQGTALNLSNDGMFLKSSQLLGDNDRIDVLLQLTDSRQLSIPARVIWGQWVEGVGTPTAGMGIQFELETQSEKDELNRFISHLLNA